MPNNVYHLPYTKEQIEAAIAKGPIIQKVGEDSYWALWDIVSMQYVQTEYPALIGDLAEMQTEANRAEAAAQRAAKSAEEAKSWADQAAGSEGGSGAGSAEPSELEDYEMETGAFTNAGAGWNVYKFREPFEGVPSVVCQPIDFPGWVEIKQVTAEGFLYCLRKPTFTAGKNGSVVAGSVSTGSYYVASGTASSSAHTAQTLVSAVTLPSVTMPTLPTAQLTTTTDPIQIHYIAIEYGGER